MKPIGKILRELRGKMSLREASERSGLSHSYIRYLENGKRPGTNTPINPTPETLRALAKAYNYSYKELMVLAGYEDRDPVDKLIEYLELELTDEQIIERMNFKVDNLTLSEDEIKQFIAFIRAHRALKKEREFSSTTDEQ